MQTLYSRMGLIGHAMAQAISRRPVTMKARIRSHSSPREIYFGQRGTGTGQYGCTICRRHHKPYQLAASLIGRVG
jgi:hypothetical protein